MANLAGKLSPIVGATMGLVKVLTLVTVSALILWASGLPHLGAVGTRTQAARRGESGTPVLVELFTSEGCSSCPPADALLERLDQLQPVGGADLIVLSEHVDYWNSIGWKDPYSSHEYSERQSAYASQFGLGSVYTPQMIIDGQIEFVGSDERRALHVIENEIREPKTPITISSVRLSDKTITLHLEAAPLLPATAAGPTNLFLAIADDSDESHVSSGENAGRVLKHVAVVRNLIRAGTMDKTTGFSRDINVRTNAQHPQNLRIVAFLQEAHTGKVRGAGLARLPN